MVVSVREYGAVVDQPGREAAPPIEFIRPTHLRRERYESLLALSTDELRVEVADEIRGELAMSEGRQREAVHARLSAWLEMDAEDARIIARTWDEAASELPAGDLQRLYETELDSIMHGFRFQDFTRFAAFMPWLQSERGLELLGRSVFGPDMPNAA